MLTLKFCSGGVGGGSNLFFTVFEMCLWIFCCPPLGGDKFNFNSK